MICPNCGEANPDRNRFCGVCGTALEPPAAAAGEERKVVSVLFVDLVGFTAASDAADPEDVRATLRPFHAMLKREIERFGGTVEKFIGDAVMAVFGAPLAHEDDPERAVRAALRVIEAIAERNAERSGPSLSVRAAVNTGEAVVTLGARPERGEGVVAGDVVNTASRLQSAAPVDSVVVGEVTYHSTRTVIDYEPMEPVTAKGKAEPIAVWRATGARSRAAVEIERPDTPFVGREDELALLLQTFSRMVGERSVQLVTVTGEPGVGKSRITSELATWVDAQPVMVSWRRGRCLPYGEGIAFWALGEIVKAQAGILDSDRPEEVGRKVAEALEAVGAPPSEREWLAARLAPLVGLPAPSVTRDESFAAWRTFLEAAALVRPLVLLFEDLHWADEALLDFVEHVVEWSTDVPILVLGTARPELYERRPGWGGGKRNATSIALSPLSPDQTARLISALLSQAVLPAETQAALLERSGGNPLYAEEFVRMLTDRGILERSGNALRISAGTEIPLPETVQGLIAARLDTLPPERKALLQDAAVLGRVFWSGALAAMGDREDRRVREDLHELVRKELVRPVRRSSLDGQAEYAFWHVLMRDVAYRQIPRAARAAKHRAAARWIEALVGDRVEEYAEPLAHHYREALALARAAGRAEDAASLREPAIRFLAMAGSRALGLDAVKAEAYLRDTLELMPADHPERPGVLDVYGRSVWHQGRAEEAFAPLREAIAAFEARGDRLGAGEAMVHLQDVMQIHGDTAAASELLDEAVRVLEDAPPSRGLASAYVNLARRRTFEGLEPESLGLAERALSLATEIGARQEMLRARQFVGFARCSLGDLGGLDDLREALRQGLEWGLGFETVFGYGNLADWVWVVEGPAPALALYREGIAISARRGLRGATRWMRAFTVWPLFDLGRWDELVAIADEVAGFERPTAGSQLRGLAMPDRGRVLLLRGRIDEAAAAIEELLPLARGVRDFQVLLPTLVVAATVSLARGDLEAARRLAEEWLARRLPTNWAAGRHLPDLVTVLCAVGEAGRAAGLVEGFSPRGAREEHDLVSARAVLAEAAGSNEEAAVLHLDAAARWEGYGSVVGRDRALLGAGRSLLAAGRAAEARGHLGEARRGFLELRAGRLVAEADALLERATARSS